MKTMLLILLAGVFGAISVISLVLLAVLVARRNKKGNTAGKLVIWEGKMYELIPVVKQLCCADAVVLKTANGFAENAALDPVTYTDSKQENGETEFSEISCSASEEEKESDAGVVVLRRNEKIVYPQAYEALSSEQREFIDDILSHAESKEGVKKVVNDRSASVYLGKKLVVRVLIKNTVVFARLTVQNNDFCAYADSAGLNLKEKPVDIKIDGEEMVTAVKDIIDLSYRDLSAEREMVQKEAFSEEEGVIGEE